MSVLNHVVEGRESVYSSLEGGLRREDSDMQFSEHTSWKELAVSTHHANSQCTAHNKHYSVCTKCRMQCTLTFIQYTHAMNNSNTTATDSE